MWNIIILIVLFIITGGAIYAIDKLFEINETPQPEGLINTVDISSDYIVVLTMENCPFCVELQKDYTSKTNKKYTDITYKKDGTLSFDDNYSSIPLDERESINNGVNKLLSGKVLFPMIIFNKKVIRGLSDKPLLDKIFN